MKKFDNYKRNLAVLSRAGEQDLSNDLSLEASLINSLCNLSLGGKC